MLRFDPYSPQMDADPFPTYRALRNEAPCFYSEDAGMWVLTRHDDIVAALNDWRTYSSAKGNLMDELPNRAGATLGTTDPPRHNRLRALIQHAFARRNLEHLEDHIRTVAREAVANLETKAQFDLVADFTAKVTPKVLFRLLGLPPGDDDKVRDQAVLMVQTDPVTHQKGPQHLAAFEWVRDYAAAVIAERRARPTDDLISHFSTAEIDGDRLEEREVLLTTTTLIMAGIESLGGFTAMFGLNLATFPDVRRACAVDPSLIPDAIEESLRFNTSAQRFRRCITTDVVLHGQVMKAGDFVCLAYGSANRDERRWENPDVYDLERRPTGHLGFGGSVHACLGTAIAKLATRIAYEELLSAVPDFEQVDADLPWMPSTTFRSPLVLRLGNPAI